MFWFCVLHRIVSEDKCCILGYPLKAASTIQQFPNFTTSDSDTDLFLHESGDFGGAIRPYMDEPECSAEEIEIRRAEILYVGGMQMQQKSIRWDGQWTDPWGKKVKFVFSWQSRSTKPTFIQPGTGNAEAAFQSRKKKTPPPTLTLTTHWNVALHSEFQIITLPKSQSSPSLRFLTARPSLWTHNLETCAFVRSWTLLEKTRSQPGRFVCVYLCWTKK